MNAAPESFTCSICSGLLVDPVQIETGHTYNRECISRWLQDHNTCPQTNIRLNSKKLVPNHTLRKSVEEFQQNYCKVIPRNCVTLHEIIGRGSFKDVHRASFKLPNSSTTIQVAALLVRDGSLETEISVLLKLGRHPRLVSFLGQCEPSSESAGRILLTEFAPKGSLDKFVSDLDDQGTILSVRHQLAILLQVASGMEAISAANLVHRDLALRNVLVFEIKLDSPDCTNVKISDFGLTVSTYSQSYCQIQGGARPIRWMAPEALEKGRFSSKSDVWAFGVLAWELLSNGRIPYFEIMEERLSGHIVGGGKLARPDECQSDDLWAIVESCWTMRAAQRPSFTHVFLTLGQISVSDSPNSSSTSGRMASLELLINSRPTTSAHGSINASSDQQSNINNGSPHQLLPQPIVTQPRLQQNNRPREKITDFGSLSKLLATSDQESILDRIEHYQNLVLQHGAIVLTDGMSSSSKARSWGKEVSATSLVENNRQSDLSALIFIRSRDESYVQWRSNHDKHDSALKTLPKLHDEARKKHEQLRSKPKTPAGNFGARWDEFVAKVEQYRQTMNQKAFDKCKQMLEHSAERRIGLISKDGNQRGESVPLLTQDESVNVLQLVYDNDLYMLNVLREGQIASPNRVVWRSVKDQKFPEEISSTIPLTHKKALEVAVALGASVTSQTKHAVDNRVTGCWGMTKRCASISGDFCQRHGSRPARCWFTLGRQCCLGWQIFWALVFLGALATSIFGAMCISTFTSRGGALRINDGSWFAPMGSTFNGTKCDGTSPYLPDDLNLPQICLCGGNMCTETDCSSMGINSNHSEYGCSWLPSSNSWWPGDEFGFEFCLPEASRALNLTQDELGICIINAPLGPPGTYCVDGTFVGGLASFLTGFLLLIPFWGYLVLGALLSLVPNVLWFFPWALNNIINDPCCWHISQPERLFCGWLYIGRCMFCHRKSEGGTRFGDPKVYTHCWCDIDNDRIQRVLDDPKPQCCSVRS